MDLHVHFCVFVWAQWVRVNMNIHGRAYECHANEDDHSCYKMGGKFLILIKEKSIRHSRSWETDVWPSVFDLIIFELEMDNDIVE